MNQKKKYVLIWLFTATAIFLFVVLVNYIVDPYQQYRKASFYPVLYEKNQRYMLPGMIKNYDYDSIVIGSSMTQNFILSDVRKYLDFNKPIKLTPSSTTAYEAKQLIELAFKYKKVRQVLYGLDLFAFIGKKDRVEKDVFFPSYLYDNNIWNDYQYLCNFDIFIKSLKSIIIPFFDTKNILYNYDYMWQWQHYFKKFRIERVYETYFRKIKFLKHNDDEKIFLEMKESFDANLLSIIQQHPETDFIIFYPPYSILTFKYWEKTGFLISSIKFKEYVFRKLKKFKNVQIYDFQIEKNILYDLSNYRDYSHYHQKINIWMLKEIAKKHFIVTDKNIKKKVNTLKKIVIEYPEPVKNKEKE